MKYCSKHHANPDDAVFCNECGERLSISKPKSNICPHCRAENPKDARFCHSCGWRIAVIPDPQPKPEPNPSPIHKQSAIGLKFCHVTAIIAGFFLFVDILGIVRTLNGLAASPYNPFAAFMLTISIVFYFIYVKSKHKTIQWTFITSYMIGIIFSLIDPDHPEDIYATILFIPPGLLALVKKREW